MNAIKDKINPKLKERLKTAIQKTIDTGREQGFFICKSKDGKLFADKDCSGEECSLTIGRPQDACQGEINQGDFHTHPYTSLSTIERMILIRTYGYDRVENDLKNVVKEEFKRMHKREGLENMPISTPSYMDAIKALGFKCDGTTQGTVCIGTDIEKDRLECWTVKETDKDSMTKNCQKMEEEYIYAQRLGSDMPVKKWIVPLFNKEVINLKDD